MWLSPRSAAPPETSRASPFLEAIRQVGLEQGKENCCYIHVVLVPYIKGSDEYKSKPAQHSVKELQGMGIAPNIIVMRADGPHRQGDLPQRSVCSAT